MLLRATMIAFFYKFTKIHWKEALVFLVFFVCFFHFGDKSPFFGTTGTICFELRLTAYAIMCFKARMDPSPALHSAAAVVTL